MKKKLVICLLSFLTAVFIFPESINKSLPALGISNLEIDIITGYVIVKNSNVNEITLQGELGKDAKKIIFEKNGDTVNIKLITSKIGFGLFKDEKTDITVTLPEFINVKVKSVSASIDVNVQNEKTILNTVSGNINGEIITQELIIDNVSGRVNISGESDSTDINIISGDINLSGNFPDISSKTVSGEINIETKNSIRGLFSTISGKISFKCSPKDNSKIEIVTTSGNINTVFINKIVPNINAKTQSGRIYINGLGDQTDFLSDNDKVFDYTLSKGIGRLKINTFSGNIKITLNK